MASDKYITATAAGHVDGLFRSAEDGGVAEVDHLVRPRGGDRFL